MTVLSQSYLDTAIKQRFQPICKEIGAALDPPLSQVLTYFDDALVSPYGIILPSGDITTRSISGREQFEIYGVIFSLILGERGTGFDGKLLGKLWLWMPTVLRHIKERREMIYEPGQAVPDYFHSLEHSSTVASGIGPDGVDRIGLDFYFDFTFRVPIKPKMGNH